MKKSFRKTALLAAAILAVYLLGLAIGLLVVYSYPIYSHRNYFLENIRAAAAEYPRGAEETLRTLSGPNTHILIYNAAGERVLHVLPTAGMPDPEPELSLGDALAAVLSGREIFRPVFPPASKDVTIIAGVPVSAGGSVTGGILLVRSVMDLPEAATAFLIFYTAAYALAAALLAVDRRRRRRYEELRQNYVANVTHALKAPVASVKALTETLSELAGPEQVRESVYYGMILREVNQQTRTIQEILDLSKLQSHGTDLTRTSVDAAAALARIREKYETLCECMDVSLHITDAALGLPTLYTNADCLNQLLEILMDNALKFVDEGGNIVIDGAAVRRQAVIRVWDDGTDISKEDLPHIFKRFYKAGGERNKNGSGLGLAIAKEIIDGLKEKIWVKSEPGKGTAFYFTVRIK